MKKYIVTIITIASLIVLTACGNDTEPAGTEVTTETEIVTETEVSETEEANSGAREALENYVAERGEGIAGGFEARDMTHSANVSVANDEAVLIAITLDDEFVQNLGITAGFLLATLEEEVYSVMPIFSEEAENVSADLRIDGFHFIIEFSLTTGDILAWQSIYGNEVLGMFMTDLSFLEVDTPDATSTVDGDVTSIEFDGLTVSLTEPIVMTDEEFKNEFPEWLLTLATHYQWLLVYAEITNNTTEEIDFGNRPFLITDEFGDLNWQSTAYDRLNDTGFDMNGIISQGESLSGYVPFIVSRHASEFEIDVRPNIVDQLSSPFSGHFIFNFDID